MIERLIADTHMSRILDQARRDQWARMADPARPEHPPERYLHDHGSYRTEPLDNTVGGPVSHEEQRRAQDERDAKDAAAQVEWEAQAQEAWEASEHGAQARRERNSAPALPGEGDNPQGGGGGKAKRRKRGSTEGKTNDGEADA